MRRKDRQVDNLSDIMEIMKKCDSCSLAFFDEEYPYIVPMNFGIDYENGASCLYFHGAAEGKKMTLLKKCGRVGFEMNCNHKLVAGPRACDYTMEFESVCGNGTIEVVENHEEKLRGLKALMKQYSDSSSFEFSPQQVKGITILRLRVNEIMGKRCKNRA